MVFIDIDHLVILNVFQHPVPLTALTLSAVKGTQCRTLHWSILTFQALLQLTFVWSNERKMSINTHLFVHFSLDLFWTIQETSALFINLHI